MIINIVNICLFFLLTSIISPSEGTRVSGAMNRLWIVRSLRVNMKIMMNERKVKCLIWDLKEKEKKRLNVMEVKCLRRKCGVTRHDTVLQILNVLIGLQKCPENLSS